MAIFDQLSSHLALYLYDGHLAGQHNLSDLYELVQYAGNIVPRLYLMITVGSVYMRVAAKLLAAENPPNQETYQGEVPPIKELLNDMLEMARGVQHPTRGLFLRYYLSVMTRDHMPNFVIDSPLGTLSTSIHFILQNFIEMNKLWVRLQYIGHSSERDKREVERKELRVIVGSGIAATTSPYPHNALIEPHPTRPTSTSYCGNFTDLLRLLPHTSRRKVAHAVAKSAIQSAADPKQLFLIDTCDGVEAVFGELCSVLVTDCVDGNVCGPKHVPMKRGEDDQSVEEQRVLLEKLDWEDVQEEQNWIAKLIHTVKSRTADPDEDLEETAISGRLLSTYHFMSETILALSRANFSYLDSGDDTYADAPSGFGTGIPTPAECSIRLFLSSALCANESGHEEAAYEFIVNALTVFEDSMLDSKTQVAMLTLVLGALEKMDVFGEENYDTLLTKVVGYCGKMIRK
ncbi:Vacuolar protein sorting-associated protein 35, partial [Rhizoclosmatium hyalinum]